MGNLYPKDFPVLHEGDSKVDYMPSQLLFENSIGSLHQLFPEFFLRGSQGVIDRPYEVELVGQPLEVFYFWQNALADLNGVFRRIKQLHENTSNFGDMPLEERVDYARLVTTDYLCTTSDKNAIGQDGTPLLSEKKHASSIRQKYNLDSAELRELVSLAAENSMNSDNKCTYAIHNTGILCNQHRKAIIKLSYDTYYEFKMDIGNNFKIKDFIELVNDRMKTDLGLGYKLTHSQIYRLKKLHIGSLNQPIFEIPILHGLANFFSSDSVLVSRYDTAAILKSIRSQYEDSVQQLEAAFQDPTSNICNILRDIEKCIVGAAGIVTPESIEFLNSHLRDFHYNHLPEVRAYKDSLRRTIERAFQNIIGKYIESIDGLITEYQNNPSLSRARLVDTFARKYTQLHISDDSISILKKARNVYHDFIQDAPDSETYSAVTSLILLDLMIGDTDNACKNLDHVLGETSGKKVNLTPRLKFLGWLRKQIDDYPRNWEIDYNSIPLLGLHSIGLGDQYHPRLLQELNDVILQYQQIHPHRNGKSPVKGMLEYAQSICFSVDYKNSNGSKYRILRFNQEPLGIESDKTGSFFECRLEVCHYGRNPMKRVFSWVKQGIDDFRDISYLSPMVNYLLNTGKIQGNIYSMDLAPSRVGHGSKSDRLCATVSASVFIPGAIS